MIRIAIERQRQLLTEAQNIFLNGSEKSLEKLYKDNLFLSLNSFGLNLGFALQKTSHKGLSWLLKGSSLPDRKDYEAVIKELHDLEKVIEEKDFRLKRLERIVTELNLKDSIKKTPAKRTRAKKTLEH